MIIPGRSIFRIRFGSHLYGTLTSASDLDYKSVYVPHARDILLGRAKGSVSTKRVKAEGEKNFVGEVDEEAYTLQRFLGLLAEGQTVALDVLFAPPFAWVDAPSPEWFRIRDNAHRLVTRKSAAFVGYCRQQANKYGIKGSRVAAARTVLAELNRAVDVYGTAAKLAVLDDRLRGLANLDHIAIVPIEQVSGQITNHLEVCGRKLAYSASIKNGRDVIQRLVDEYGHRALQAESQQGVDWKALSHAVRVATQALELLRTGEVTFPLPNAAHVLAIKTGSVPYKGVAAEIEGLLVEVEAASNASSLQAEPDYPWIDDLVAEIYVKEVRHG